MRHETGLDLKRTSRCIKALSDPTRFKILKLLQFRTACVCELSSVLGFAQPTISRHMRLLEDAGFVRSKRRRFRVNYWLRGDDAPPVTQQLLTLVRGWHEEDREIKRLREQLEVTIAQMCEVSTLAKDDIEERKTSILGNV